MNIIFLDIDGVLNSANWAKVKTKAPIFGATSDTLAISRINRALKDRGLNTYLFGATPPIGNPRGSEIQAWLDMAGDTVEQFIILDDDSDMGERLMPRLVQTSWEQGLTKELATKAVVMFINGPES